MLSRAALLCGPALGRAVSSAGRGATLRRFSVLLAAIAVGALALPTLPIPGAGPHALAAAPPAVTPSDLAGSWSTFHGSENRSGFSATDGPEHGDVLWDVAAPGPVAYPVQAGIVVDASYVYASNNLGDLDAFNRSDNGSLAWQSDLGGTLSAVDRWGAELVVANAGGSVDALWAANGSRRWSTSVDGGVLEGVAATGGRVFLGTTAGSLYALNASTGAVVWRIPVGAPLSGAVAVEGSTVVGVTAVGGVLAVTTDGAPLWSASVGAEVNSSAAVSDGRVLVADESANVTSLWLANGTVDWVWAGRATSAGDRISSTPAVGLGNVYTSSQLGILTALSVSNGSPTWRVNTGFAGYPVLSSPALTPRGLYVADANLDIIDLDPADGALVWRTPLGFVPSYPAPAVDGGVLYVGTELGSVVALGARSGPPHYPVSGRVTDPNGTPIALATVATAGALATTNATGGFALALANGSYTLTASALGYTSTSVPIVVAGPLANLSLVLVPVAIVRVEGEVVNGASGLSVANATVRVEGSGLTFSTVSGPDGRFSVAAPVGTDYLTVSSPPGYGPAALHIDVPSSGLTGLRVGLPPVVPPPTPWALVGALAAMACALVVVGLWEASRRRAELGQPARLFSPFAQYIAMRLALLPAQIVAILAILFLFGTILPSAFYEYPTCSVSAWACYPGSWQNPLNPPLAFLGGFWAFLQDMFTGQWGSTNYGHLVEPAAQFLAWWLPNSIEIALFALPIAAGIAYAVGLYVGGHQDRAGDLSVRLVSVAGLLTPTFLLALLFLGAFYDPFFRAIGDVPYGILPSVAWFSGHGGIPTWIGIAETTSPTTIPLLDGVLHGDWPFVGIVFLKVLWQAVIIALVYVAIFLRFARHAVAAAFSEPHVLAARARGVPEATILWRHTGRRVIPLFLLVFGLTLPIYLGTQAVVEALANDPGVGTLLIAQMTQVSQNGFGFHQLFPSQHPGSLYQVTIFGLVILVLLGNLFADILARYLDPRLLRSRR